MKKIFTSVAMIGATMAMAQVGINNEDPKATLDVTAKTTNGTKPEGIIAPRLTGDQIKAADAQYLAEQTGTIVYATSAVNGTPAGKTINITAAGYYYFDGAIWQKFNSGAAAAGTEPWYDVATNTGATANTQNIYQMGNVGVGMTTPTAKLNVVDTITTAIGSATSYASQDNILTLNHTTDPNQSFMGERSQVVVDPSNSTAYTRGALSGFYRTLDYSGASFGNVSSSKFSGPSLKGSQSEVIKGGTGYVNYGSGISSEFRVEGGATVGRLQGIRNITTALSSVKQPLVIGVDNFLYFGETAGAGIETYKGINLSYWGNMPTFATTVPVDNFYGIYLDNSLANVNSSNKWGFYDDLGFPSYFKGRVGIGTNAPSNALHINATNPVRLEGLQAGAATDNVVVADVTGVLKTVPAASLGGGSSTEPWYNVTTSAGATANNQDIYQMGKIGIGTKPTDAYLQINNIADFPDKVQYRFTPNGLGLRATNPQRAGVILSQVNDVTATFNDASTLRFERYRGTQTNLLPLLNGDAIGTIDAQGTVTPNVGQTGARIAFAADGDWSTTNRKTHIIFATNTNNTDVTEKMRLSGQGYLGIGTTTPQNPLHIISSGNTGGIRIDDANAWSAKLETNYLTFDRPGPAFVLNTSTDAAAMMRLGVGSSIPSSPRKGITILQSGYVGVGQASPQAPLHIEKVTASDITPVIIKDLPSYASEAAGAADAALPSGGLYKVTGSNVLYVKP
ncbi:hypothetical protein [Epilithonimonas hungarica]|uniref:Uncharacterized protein n=1 Tax=Epilithonimonas hungarica TaxID=454006 RepID=A0A1G7JJR8_9FLAO|nr:hypothetical protein [Epilithonimonas hungarica]SDF25024.1 hypothetical protein SAMN05421825_1403 [Epilithonimonas hungarica]